MLVVGAVLGGAAGGEGAFGVQHAGEVAKVLAGVVTGCLIAVVAGAVEVLELENDLPSAVFICPNPYPPGGPRSISVSRGGPVAGLPGFFRLARSSGPGLPRACAMGRPSGSVMVNW